MPTIISSIHTVIIPGNNPAESNTATATNISNPNTPAINNKAPILLIVFINLLFNQFGINKLSNSFQSKIMKICLFIIC